jgi:thymidylate synthase
MADAHFGAKTLDDALRRVIEEVIRRGDRTYPTKGGPEGALEIRGVLVEISDPRARLSRTETRGRIFSALGELSWYLARKKDAHFISYYIQKYKDLSEGGEIFGGYGPRLFDWKGVNQISKVTEVLRTKPDSRQAVVQLFDALDISEKHKDVPCTCTLQFMLRRVNLNCWPA